MDIEQLKALRAKLLEQTPQARKIIAVLYDTADWTTRDEIADKLRKTRLNLHDISLLDRLSANGFIEIKKCNHPGRIGFEFIYRLKADVHRNLNNIRVFQRKSLLTPRMVLVLSDLCESIETLVSETSGTNGDSLS